MSPVCNEQGGQSQQRWGVLKARALCLSQPAFGVSSALLCGPAGESRLPEQPQAGHPHRRLKRGATSPAAATGHSATGHQTARG